MASPQLEIICQMLASTRPIAPERTLLEQRADLEAMAGGAPLPDGARKELVRAGGVPAEWVWGADAGDDGAILYLHGGGYVMGSITTHRSHVARLSQATGVRGLALDYRLAPEHAFPAAVDDAVAAYEWLLDHGVAPRRVAIAGDSAGGGLTVSTLVALRDRGRPLPAAGVCLSPWVDLALTGASMDEKAAVDPMVQRDRLARMAEAYLGSTDPQAPLASPLHADLRGLPPLLVQVGTRETLLDDASRLADRARAAGVDVTYEAWDDMIHVWQCFAPLLPEADEAIARIGSFLRARLGS